MVDVIGIGSAVYDMLMRVDEFPKEDTKMQASATRIQSGGPCAAALGAMSKLGLYVEYVGTMANDGFGKTMLNDFQKYNVGTRYVRVVEDCESFHAVVLISEKGSTRTCVWNRGSVPSPLPADVPVEAIRAARYLYLDGHHHDAALFAALKAKEFGVKVVLDAGGLYPGMADLVALTDLLIPSEEFAQKFTGQATAEGAAQSLYAAYHPAILVITQGQRGGLIFDGHDFTRYPAFAVDAYDTNGAGDVFHGAFVAGHAHGMQLLDNACFASAVSAIKCMHFGAREGVPTFEQTLEFLNARGVTLHG